jgi:DNA modification methylase
MGWTPVNILVGDVRERLRDLPDDHFDCVVTSPPYWGLRDYGVAGQIGLEPTLGEHLDVMVEVCREIRRVLKPSGTFWLNYGDCYATSPNGRSAADTKALTDDDRTFRDKPFSTIGPIYEQQPDSRQAARRSRAGKLGNGGENGTGIPAGRVVAGGLLKAKDLCMVPNRMAIALQEDGWWVRSEIIWAKPNPMPESINDRPATAHEKIFMLTKSARYAYDADEVRQGRVSDGDYKTPDGWDTGPGGHGSVHRSGRQKGESVADKKAKRQDDIAAAAAGAGGSSARRMEGFNERWALSGPSRKNSFAREGKLSPGEHWQKPQFRADRDVVDYSGSRNLRNYEPAPVQVWNLSTRPFSEAHFATFPPELAERCIKAGCPAGGTVLDPFGGAGTTALVAWRLQRACTLIELNPEYAEITRARLEAEQGMWANIQIDAGAPSERVA